jgi:hypothetical protein
VVLACLGCVGFGVLGTNLLGQFIKQVGEPAVVVTGYSVALQTHDYDTAHTYLSNDVGGRVSADQLQADWAALEAQGSVTNSNFESINVENDRGTVTWVLTVAGHKYRTDLSLRKIGSDWKITGGDPGLVPAP